MDMVIRAIFGLICISHFLDNTCECAKINTPRVLLPWFANTQVNFTFEIFEGGCYSWSLSRDDIIDLEPLYDDSWGHCSRAARVSVSKTCTQPGSVIILAEEVSSGEILRGDVDIDHIKSLKVMSTTWKLFLEEAPEAFEVFAYDDQGNKFSTLEGVSFQWTIENLGDKAGEAPLVTLVGWSDTDYEAPRGVTDLEAGGLRASMSLLYGQAMGEAKVTACLGQICTDFTLQVVASVVLTPAVATIAPGDTIRYRVVRARAGRLTVENIGDTLYHLSLPDESYAYLEDSISLVRASNLGTTHVHLMSGSTEVAKGTLTISEPHSIKITIRPSSLVVKGEMFLIHCVVLDKDGHALFAGDQMLVRLAVDGEANVDLIRSTENGTLTDAVAKNSGQFTVTARLHSIAGRQLSNKVESQLIAEAIDPLEVDPEELFVAWTDIAQEVNLKHIGGGSEPVVWSESETEKKQDALTLSPKGLLKVRGPGDVTVRVQLQKYSYVKAFGRVWSLPPSYLQVWSGGAARAHRPHRLHVALTAPHPLTGEPVNLHTCDCAAFTVTWVDGPEPHNVTAAPWATPTEGACCVLEAAWASRGVSSLRVSLGGAGQTVRIPVLSAPRVLWPVGAAVLPRASIPLLALGEALSPHSLSTSVAELSPRDAAPPHMHPDVQLFTVKCHSKGETRLQLISQVDEENELVEVEAICAPHVSKIRLEGPETPGNCSGGPRVWLRPGREVQIKTSLYDGAGRELFSERGPRAAWEVAPTTSIVYRAPDRLLLATRPEFAPVPVPLHFYQTVVADAAAVGWTGLLKVTIPEASATIQAKVVSPLKVEVLQINVAWEGETPTTLGTVSGGSGKYEVWAQKGVTAGVEGGQLQASVPAPGVYSLTVLDSCVTGETETIEFNVEEILSVEVSTARAVCSGGCVPVAALVRGMSHQYLTTSKEPEWHVTGNIEVRGDKLCGLREGAGRVRAAQGGVWSPDVEVLVFPPLSIWPESAQLPPTARLPLRPAGGPPPHLATFTYSVVDNTDSVDVSYDGVLQGLTIGTSRVRLVAKDINGLEMASAESVIEVIPITGLRVSWSTQTLLVGAPGGLWLSAGGLGPRALHALQPPPRAVWTLRDPKQARLYNTHRDDLLERSTVEGLSVRVVPLKPGIITIDVRVRNMGQLTDSRSWDSTVEILGITDITVGVEGGDDLATGDRVALAVGSTVKLRTSPRSSWKLYGDEDALTLTSTGELRALRPGRGVAVASSIDDRNNVHRETSISVESSVPAYCTVHPADDDDPSIVRVTLRDQHGRALLAPAAAPRAPHALLRPTPLGNELILQDLPAGGGWVSAAAAAAAAGGELTDEVWVEAGEITHKIVAVGGWAVCLDGVGWRAPTGVTLHEAGDVTLAVLSQDAAATHALRADRPTRRATVHQLPVDKFAFSTEDDGSASTYLTISADGLTGGPLVCTPEQLLALQGVAVTPPHTCRAASPHSAEPVLDFENGQLGCRLSAAEVSSPTPVEVCAQWGAYRACARPSLLPTVRLSQSRLTLQSEPASFSVSGHPRALRALRITPSPGLSLETSYSGSELVVTVRSEVGPGACGAGAVRVRAADYELTVEVEKECELACGSLLGALFAFLAPYMATLATIAGVAAASYYLITRQPPKSPLLLPPGPPPPSAPSSPPSPRGTWPRSPYAAGPAPPAHTHTAPVYGDASVLPDNSFSPNSTRSHSRFL